MGQIRHGCAPTTQAIKATIQRSQAMNAAPSREDGINVKTVAKWRERETLDNRKTGLTELGLTERPDGSEPSRGNDGRGLRRHTLLPLDDCLYALHPSIPHLTRSSLHRFLQPHARSRLPDREGDKPKWQKFKRYPIGYFHIEVAELCANEGQPELFVAIGPPENLW